jgi:hypothetical protein
MSFELESTIASMEVNPPFVSAVGDETMSPQSSSSSSSPQPAFVGGCARGDVGACDTDTGRFVDRNEGGLSGDCGSEIVGDAGKCKGCVIEIGRFVGFNGVGLIGEGGSSVIRGLGGDAKGGAFVFDTGDVFVASTGDVSTDDLGSLVVEVRGAEEGAATVGEGMGLLPHPNAAAVGDATVPLEAAEACLE